MLIETNSKPVRFRTQFDKKEGERLMGRFLGIDIGTTSLKAAVFSETGERLALKTVDSFPDVLFLFFRPTLSSPLRKFSHQDQAPPEPPLTSCSCPRPAQRQGLSLRSQPQEHLLRLSLPAPSHSQP